MGTDLSGGDVVRGAGADRAVGERTPSPDPRNRREPGGETGPTRIADSVQYRHLWGTAELASVFGERARLGSWLRILAALARAQASLGIIPADAASAIEATAADAAVDPELLDLDAIARDTRRTSHSTLGFIHELQRVLPAEAREYVYYGATVQDLTDTWTVLAMRDVGEVAWRELRAIEASALLLAERHRTTPMAGRTHGQPGAPITFGFKASTWADEIRRHIDRLADGRSRWLVGQLGGAVGALGFFGAKSLPLRRAFCAELGLAEPAISWLTARDRIAEFATVLAMICTTLARIGGEVYELSRPEIDELREPLRPDAVGSITMPHKRNPEAAEHLDTLARLARAQAAVLVEGMSGSHERDGRSWKAEWVALPEVCLLTGTALQLAAELVADLEVHAPAMAENLGRFGDSPTSEQLLAGLSGRVGKHRAQQILQQEAAAGRGGELGVALIARGTASADDVAAWTAAPSTDTATAMVDEVLRQGRAARAAEPDRWAP